MEQNGGSSAPYLARTPCVPLFVHCLISVETEGLLDYQGRAGIISIVRWNLRPVIVGVEQRIQETPRNVPRKCFRALFRSSFPWYLDKNQGKAPKTPRLFTPLNPRTNLRKTEEKQLKTPRNFLVLFEKTKEIKTPRKGSYKSTVCMLGAL